jgi:hypothetical protein
MAGPRAYFFCSGFLSAVFCSAVAGAAGAAPAAGAEAAGAAGAGACSFLPQAVSAMATKAETKSVRFIIRESWMIFVEGVGIRDKKLIAVPEIRRGFQQNSRRMPHKGNRTETCVQSPSVVAKTAGEEASHISAKRSMNVCVPIGSSRPARPLISSKWKRCTKQRSSTMTKGS